MARQALFRRPFLNLSPCGSSSNEACMSISGPISGCKWRTFDWSWCLTEGTFISASATPYCGIKQGEQSGWQSSGVGSQEWPCHPCLLSRVCTQGTWQFQGLEWERRVCASPSCRLHCQTRGKETGQSVGVSWQQHEVAKDRVIWSFVHIPLSPPCMQRICLA